MYELRIIYLLGTLIKLYLFVKYQPQYNIKAHTYKTIEQL